MSNVGEVYYNETDYGDDVTGSKTDVLLGINLEIRSQLFSWTGKGPCKGGATANVHKCICFNRCGLSASVYSYGNIVFPLVRLLNIM